MIDVPIQALPNQALSIQLDGSRYEITLKEANGCMCASVIRDGETLVDGVRLVAGTPVLPYLYQEQGNLVLITLGNDLPYYTDFAVTQFLVYLTPAELEELRA